MNRLKQHFAVVTGGGAGIGRAIAVRLAEEGSKVLVNDLSLENAQRTADFIQAAGGIARGVGGDVSQVDAVESVFNTCEATWGPATLVVNNAGILTQSVLVDMAIEDFDRMIAVHLRGCFLCCRRAIGPMLAAGNGSIINIASQLGQIGGVELSHYAAAKAGIIGFTKSLAREVSCSGVRVNAVAPVLSKRN